MLKKKWIMSLLLISGLLATSTVTYAERQSSSSSSTASSEIMDVPSFDGQDRAEARFPAKRAATGNKLFIFDPNADVWAIYDANGNRVTGGRASAGKNYCPDLHRACHTVVGQFRVIEKGGPGCVSHKFPIKSRGGSPMPYCMVFHPKGYAIHGSYEVPKYVNASHGCIRVQPPVAKWLSQNFITIGTTVIVLPYGRGRH